MMWIALGQTGVDCQCPGGITACQALMEITMRQIARIRDVIKNGFADPDFGSYEVAAKAGISLRYLQKLFIQHGLTCSEFIYSVRLDRAAHLLHRRVLLGASQSLSKIGYASGFSDYTHFARKFRHRFGHSPGTHPD
jgi:AraC family transcriptional regulator, positive regulator of tynA and feaB